MDPRLADIFRDKPELVIDFPDWMKPVTPSSNNAKLGMVELAGRDSVAAAVKAVEELGLTALVPTLAYTGTEHGAWSWVERALERLEARLPEGVEILPLLVMGSPRFWRALNSRHLSDLVSRYGFAPICVGCHLYLHSLRIPLAKRLGAVIISGERESHDGKLKINQLAPALDAYAALARELGASVAHPIRHLASGGEIARLAGDDWPEGGEQLACALSGNYKGLDGAVVPPSGLSAYLEEFALPLARGVVTAYLEGRTPNHLALSAETLSRAN